MAIEDNRYFKVSDMEIRRRGKTYTVDTLNELHTIYGEKVKFYFIIGEILYLKSGWRKAADIFNRCAFIVYNRWVVQMISWKMREIS